MPDPAPPPAPPAPAAPPSPQTVRLLDPDGQIRDVSLDSAPTLLQDPRWQVAKHTDELARLQTQVREENYGGIGGGVKAVGAGLARGVTLGLSDVAARALGGDQAAITLAGLREVNPGLSTGSEIIGAVAPALVTGGASLPSGAVAKVGAGVASRVGAAVGEGALGKVVAATAGGIAEGGLFGLGQGTSDLALSTDPLTLEHAASVLSSNALYGAALGGALGGATKAAEVGLRRAKGALDDVLERNTSKATSTEQAIDTGDLEQLDRQKLKVAREEEIAKIQGEMAPARQSFVDDLKTLRTEGKKDQLWLAADGATEREAREAGRNFVRADLSLDRRLADRIGLAEKPERALADLRAQRQALDSIESWGRKITADHDAQFITDPDLVRDAIRTGKVPGEVGPFTPAGMDYAVEREIDRRIAARALPMEPAMAKRVARLEKIPDAIERNERLQQRIAEMTAEPISPRLDKIAEAEAALGAPKEGPSLGAQMLGAVPIVGPIAKVAQSALGGLRGAAKKSALRLGRGVSSFLDVAAKGAAKAEPYAPVLATAALRAASYAPAASVRATAAIATAGARRATAGGVGAAAAKVSEAAHDLARLFADRTDEIKSQVHIAPDGTFQMRGEARAKMAAKFDPIRSADPMGADQLETAGARRIEWLASQIPRRPDIAAVPGMGGDRWQPSDMEMRAFARQAAAVEDPLGVIERAAHGAITPEDAAAVRAVYPGLLEHALGEIMTGLSTAKKPLPYKRRLALSILAGQPLDPALHPAVLSVLQSSYANDEGVPQTSPAMPMPAFGSVKKSVPQPTPAQERSQGELDA